MGSKLVKMEFRRSRVRKALKAAGKLRPRLSVFRSAKHIYAQAIDDVTNTVLASASDLEEALKGELTGKKKADKAKLVGQSVAKKLLAKNISSVVFDRNGYIYHGRVSALADAAREGGLKF